MSLRRTLAVAAIAGLLGGCTTASVDVDDENAQPGVRAPEASTPADSSVQAQGVAPADPSRDATGETDTPSTTDATADDVPPPHPVSLPALMQARYDGGDLRLGAVVASTGAFTIYAVTYRSSGLQISGLLYVPAGDGPFPAVVLNHGYIDPDVYVTGQGLAIEADYLVRSGFVVLHTDYRNHAGSDRDPRNDLRLRLGYTEDAINAVRALRRSDLPAVDPARIGMMGRSMGGGVTLNALVVRPRIVDAAVIYASVSSKTADNHRKWTRGGRPALADRIENRYGSPRENPDFWRNVSPRTFADRVAVPVLVHHGTADDTCPIEWADETVAALRDGGVDVTYRRYPGEGHAFSQAWAPSMAETVSFFREHLGRE
jgi:dienelactone hydrolase